MPRTVGRQVVSGEGIPDDADEREAAVEHLGFGAIALRWLAGLDGLDQVGGSVIRKIDCRVLGFCGHVAQSVHDQSEGSAERGQSLAGVLRLLGFGQVANALHQDFASVGDLGDEVGVRLRDFCFQFDLGADGSSEDFVERTIVAVYVERGVVVEVA